MSLANNIEFLKRLPKPARIPGFAEIARGLRPDLHSPLFEVKGFGTNPGALRMRAFVPASLQQPRPLVVVLHGCGQTAAGYDLGAGWSTLAKHYGFALLMPEQQLSNNANACFNWFSPEDTARGCGEAGSIRQMIARMVRDYSIDPHRIFVTGLSAGGAMTSVMLATYPELFAAGAVIAGLPFGVASNMREALSGMRGSAERSAGELGDRVRHATPQHRGRWPRVSVWHGTADRVVHPGNANEIVKQWLDVHELPPEPMAQSVVDGHPRQVWWGADGETLVESYTITDMAHGTPLGMADNDNYYGSRGAFLIEAGISSSYHIAKFFGLTAWIREARKAEPKIPVADSPSAKLIPSVSPFPVLPIALPDLAKALAPLTGIAPRPGQKAPARAKPRPPSKPRRRRAFDLGAIITRALTAAGFRKR